MLWFRVPRLPTDPELPGGRLARGQILAILPRHASWQLAWVFPKGHYERLHAEGIDALRARVRAVIPELADRIDTSLSDWRAVSLLSVDASRLRRWYRPGLLLLGDAAHVMSPIAGVGINYAIQDAVVAARYLVEPLRGGRIGTWPLLRVQLARELPTRFIQTLQHLLQQRLLGSLTEPSRTPLPTWLLRVPVLRNLPARIVGFGLWRVHPRR